MWRKGRRRQTEREKGRGMKFRQALWGIDAPVSDYKHFKTLSDS